MVIRMRRTKVGPLVALHLGALTLACFFFTCEVLCVGCVVAMELLRQQGVFPSTLGEEG